MRMDECVDSPRFYCNHHHTPDQPCDYGKWPNVQIMRLSRSIVLARNSYGLRG